MIKKIVRFLLPVIIIIGCVLAARWLISNKDKPNRHKQERPPLIVDAVRLKKENYQIILTSNGTVRPHTQSTLVSEISGKIERVSSNFREGGYFKPGEELLTIDDRSYQAAVVKARSAVISAEFDLEQERIRVKNYETDLIIAESAVAQAQLALAEEEAKARQAKEDWARLNPGQTPDELVLRGPQVFSAAAAVASAEAQVEQIKRNIELGSQQLAAADGAVAAANADLEEKRLSLERTRITMPYAGRILEKSVDIGQYVSPGSNLATVYAIDYVEIRVPLSNQQLGFIDLPERYRGERNDRDFNGPKATIRARIGRTDYVWNGEIVQTEGAIDSRSRQLFVIAKVDDPYGRMKGDRPPLKVGQFVEVGIEGDYLEDVFLIPRSAVREGKEVLIIDENNQVHRRLIDIIWSNVEIMVVKESLEIGELLCITPIPFAVDGTVVQSRIGEILAYPETNEDEPLGHRKNREQRAGSRL